MAALIAACTPGASSSSPRCQDGVGAECRSGAAQFCPEPAHLHGDNHPAVSIAIGTAPVVRSTDLSLGLHFCVVDTIPGFTYRVMVDHIRTGRVVQQREQVFTQQANASRYDAHLNLRDVPGDGQAGIQRLLIVVWDMCTEIKPSEALVGRRDFQFMPPPLPPARVADGSARSLEGSAPQERATDIDVAETLHGDHHPPVSVLLAHRALAYNYSSRGALQSMQLAVGLQGCIAGFEYLLRIQDIKVKAGQGVPREVWEHRYAAGLLNLICATAS